MSTKRPTYDELAERVSSLECQLAEQTRSRDFYRSFVENANDLAYSLDADATVTYCGPQSSRYGYAPSDIEGRPVGNIIHPDDLAGVVDDLRRTLETGEEFPTRFRLVSADGREVNVEDYGRVVRGDDGRVTGVVGFLRDVTGRVEAEHRAEQSRNEQRAFRVKLAALHEVTLELSQADSFDALCRRAVELGLERLGFERLGLWFIEDKPLVVRGSFGTDADGAVCDERGETGPIGPQSLKGLFS